MKNWFAPSILALAFVVCSTMHAWPQPALDQSPILDPIAQMSLGMMDIETGEIVDAAGVPVPGEVNSPEAVRQRLDSILQITDPVQYLIDHPLTPEQQAALDESVNRALHPKTLQEHLAELTPEERAKEEEIIAAFLFPQPVAPDPLFVESDFNGDRAPEVVFEHQGGSIGAWFMNKGPNLISASLFKPEAIDLLWHIVGTGDFNKDRKTDLLLQHEDGSLAVSYMDGTNSISTAHLSPSQPDDGWKVVGTGDLNHDGKKDILFQHTDGRLAVWFMDGINLMRGSLLNADKLGESGWGVVGTAALSSVGNTDLILQHTDGTLGAWYLDGINLVQSVLLNPSTPGEAGWRVATTLDLNADGKTDLLLQNEDGRVAVWLMDGINLISGNFLNPENPGTGWRIAGPR